MTPEERKLYQEYLDDFDPTPQHGGDDYDYPLSADSWLEMNQRQDEAVIQFMKKHSAAFTKLADS